jgi:predicted permease
MRTLRGWVLRLAGIFRRRKDEQNFQEQIQADIELHTEDGISAGMSRADARRAALTRFGGVDAATEAWREQRGVPFLETLARDVRHTFRVLGRNKAWASVFILSLALGIGANTALFSAANVLLLRKLPVPDADGLVTLRWRGDNNVITGIVDHGYASGSTLFSWLGFNDTQEFSVDKMGAGATGSYSTFLRLRAANETLDHLFAVGHGPAINLIVDGQGDIAHSQFVSGDFYAALQIPPAAGRLILPSDDQRGSAPVAVISHDYWQRRFGGKPDIVGKQVRINGVASTIIGVSGVRLPDVIYVQGPWDVTIPLANEPAFHQGTSRLDQPTNWWLVRMGRLKRGVTPAQVEANLGPVFAQASREAIDGELGKLNAKERKEVPPGWGERVPKLEVVSGARGAYDPAPFQITVLAVLGILVGIVLAIIGANLVNLSLAFTTSRQREIAIHRAIGADRRRLVRQVFTEHIVVSLLGGAASLLVAYLCLDLVRLYFTVDFDWRVVAFAFVASTATGIIIGILPALRASRVPSGSLAMGGTERRSRLATGLLVAQVALSLTLLVGAGLFVRTLINLQNVNPGFDVGRLAVFTLEPGFNRYDAPKTIALYKELTTNLRALPGVSSVTLSSEPLINVLGNFSETFSDRAEPGTPPVRAKALGVQEDFFETTGIPLRIGRDFTSQDNIPEAPGVVIINEALAVALFGKENPIGRRIGSDRDVDQDDAEVIGVVANARHGNFRAPPHPAFYYPHLQAPAGPRTFEVRTLLDPKHLVSSIRQVVQRADPTLPIIELSILNSATEMQWRQERMIALAAGSLGALAIVVSMIGLFGLMSYAVTRRTKEIAIRMALGAESGRVLLSILREYLLIVGIGILLGFGIAVSSGRFLKALLFGLAPYDPVVLGGAILLMGIVAGLAAYLPARRAASVDPMISLRHE